MLDLVKGGVRIDPESEQVGGVEFEAEARAGDQRAQLLPAFRGGRDEVVVWTGPVLDCTSRRRLRARQEIVQVVGEVP